MSREVDNNQAWLVEPSATKSTTDQTEESIAGIKETALRTSTENLNKSEKDSNVNSNICNDQQSR